ncbi:serine hydrolase domain-containing protein [Lysobacter korlensis]|uniref:Serine hydrolase domain-containing protein n=1 Tax=Lysobacter korlensis TaxID=553636 RepID=A0ABV6RT96_9GAMM
MQESEATAPAERRRGGEERMVDGVVAPGFERVREQFAEGLEHGGGAAVAVYVGGSPVVDLWGGVADRHTGRVWERDTLGVAFSCTKGVLALVVLALAEQGRLDLNAPVARYWPAFSRAGKSEIPVRWLLNHRAGLIAVDEHLTRDEALDWEHVIQVLERQAPNWEPGTGHAYHTLTFGWLVGEVIRRVTGRMPSEVIRELTGSIAPDFWLGLPPVHEARRSRPYWDEAARAAVAPADPPAEPVVRASTLGSAFPQDLIADGQGFDDPRVLEAEVPGAGGVSTARDLAAIFSAAVRDTGGVRLLNERSAAAAATVESSGPPVYGGQPPFAAFGPGFHVASAGKPLFGPGSFGHAGMGGQAAFAHPELGVGFGYLTTRLVPGDEALAMGLMRTVADILRG